MEIYKNISNNEIVYKEDAQEYAMEMLGIKIKPMEKDGTYTIEQMEIMQDIEDYYFSGNWIKDELEKNDQDIPNLERDLYYAEMQYQDNLERKWGLL